MFVADVRLPQCASMEASSWGQIIHNSCCDCFRDYLVLCVKQRHNLCRHLPGNLHHTLYVHCVKKNHSITRFFHTLALSLKLKSLVRTLMCYSGLDTIDWSYILPDDGRVIRTSTNKQECCPWPWSLVVLRDKIVVLGPGLGLGAQVLVNIAEYLHCWNLIFLVAVFAWIYILLWNITLYRVMIIESNCSSCIIVSLWICLCDVCLVCVVTVL